MLIILIDYVFTFCAKHLKHTPMSMMILMILLKYCKILLVWLKI